MFFKIFPLAWPDSDPDLDFSLEMSLEKEARRKRGRYLGDLDLGSAEVLRSLLSPEMMTSSLMSSSASSTEDTLDWCLQ